MLLHVKICVSRNILKFNKHIDLLGITYRVYKRYYYLVILLMKLYIREKT